MRAEVERRMHVNRTFGSHPVRDVNSKRGRCIRLAPGAPRNPGENHEDQPSETVRSRWE